MIKDPDLRNSCDAAFRAALNAAEAGYIIKTDSAFRLCAILREYRSEAIASENLDFADIQINISPDDSEHDLWLIKKNVLINANVSGTFKPKHQLTSLVEEVDP